MDFKISVIAFGIFAVLLVSGTSLAFGTHENELWDKQKPMKPFKNGDEWVGSVTFMVPIAKNSPECHKKGGAASLDCDDVSFYQITAYEKWKEVPKTAVTVECAKEYSTATEDMTQMTTQSERSFSLKIGNTMRHESSQSVSTSSQHEAGGGVSGTFFGIGGHADYKYTSSKSYTHESKSASETSKQIQQQSSVSYSFLSSKKLTTEKKYELSDRKMQFMGLQKMMTVKYDLWTPVKKTPILGITTLNEAKVLMKTLKYDYEVPPEILREFEIPPKLEYNNAHIYKAHDLSGDQYYIHTTFVETYPTDVEHRRFEITDWDCGRNTRITYEHTNPPEATKGLEVLFRPTKHQANFIVVDNEFKPVQGAKVKLGIPSFPLLGSEPKACTSPDRTAITDQYGSAYFYIGSDEGSQPYVFDGISPESKPDGLVAMFPGDGDYTDLVSQDRIEGGDMVIPGRILMETEATFVDGMKGKAFSFKGGSKGTQFADSDDLDLKKVTIAAWIKPTKLSSDTWQTIAAKGQKNNERNYGLFIHQDGHLHMSYNSGNQWVDVNSKPGSIKEGAWTHVAGVIDPNAGTMAVYIDGREVMRGPTSGAMIPNTAPLTIGIEPSQEVTTSFNPGDPFFIQPVTKLVLSSHWKFYGDIDEVAIFNKALPESEIKKIRDTTNPKSSACEPGQITTNQAVEVTKLGFKPITRDLAFDEQEDVWYAMQGPVTVDNNPPRLILPTSINKVTSESEMKVEYEGLRAFDAEENKEVSVSCNPQSGSVFPKSTTKVRCSAKDSSGNEAIGTFNVIVTDEGGVQIAPWIKDSAGWWGCEDSEYRTTDQEFIGALQWLIDNGIVIIPAEDTTAGTGDSSIPSWVQFAACTWAQGVSTDLEFANAIQHLIKEGIITI